MRRLLSLCLYTTLGSLVAAGAAFADPASDQYHGNDSLGVGGLFSGSGGSGGASLGSGGASLGSAGGAHLGSAGSAGSGQLGFAQNLPFTGLDVFLVLWAGLALIALGLVLRGAWRRILR